jgi:hypothetical protein
MASRNWLVQRRQRLVHQHDARFENDGPGERHPLALAARELIDVPLAVATELDQLKGTLDAAGDIAAADAAQLERKGDVGSHIHVRKQGIVLEHHAHVALVGRQANDLLRSELHAAGIRSYETGQDHQQRGLS